MTKKHSALVLLAVVCVPPVSAGPSPNAELGGLVRTITAVQSEGHGNVEASRAWQALVEKSTAKDLPFLLNALEGANPLAANWIRGAIDAVAERSIDSAEHLPCAKLEAYVKDTRRPPRVRRVAFDWLVRVHPELSEKLIPTMLDDPGVEFRREAVARVLTEANRLRTQTVSLYSKALSAARDDDQIKKATKHLRELGEEVDLPRHFGFLMHWKLIGPFDNTGESGLETSYPPEQEIDLGGEYDGKSGRVQWIDHAATDEYGTVDLNPVLGKTKGVLAYGLHEFTSDAARDVELRLATGNAWKVWLNSELLYTRNEYHHGTQLDHYIAKGKLAAGRNRILLKVCQNEQTEPWTAAWKFQIRACDATGTAILSTTRREDAAKEEMK